MSDPLTHVGAALSAWPLPDSADGAAELRSVFLAINDGVIVQGPDGRVRSFNPAAARILGLTVDQLAGRTSMDQAWEARHEDGRPFPGEMHPPMVALRTRLPERDVMMSLGRPDGSRALLRVNAEPILAPDGTPIAVVSTFVDVTAYRAAENTMRDLAGRVSDLYNHAPCGYHSVDRDGTIVEINDTELAWLGLTRDEVVGKRQIREFLTPESVELYASAFPRFRDGDLDELDLEMEIHDGQLQRRRHVIVRATAHRDEAGRLVRSRTVMTDVSELVATRTDLAQSVSDRDALLQNDFVGIMRLRDRRFTWVNTAITRMFGYTEDELIGKSTALLYAEEASFTAFGQKMGAMLRATGEARGQVELRHRDGHSLHVDLHATPTRGGDVICFLTDQTPLRNAQRAIAESERVQSVGRLTGAIAHEFNNLLQHILGTAELALSEPSTSTSTASDLHAIQESARRGAALMERLLTFARRQAVFPEVLLLNDALGDAVHAFGRTRPEAPTVLAELTEDAVSVRVDQQALSTAIRHLLDNAADAVRDGGTIVVRTGLRRVTSADEAPAADARPGDYGFVSVTDTGRGMTAAVLSQAAEPFFTTKPFGRSHGLGLSSVHGFVAQAGGWVELSSDPAHGTTAVLYLPRVSEPAP